MTQSNEVSDHPPERALLVGVIKRGTTREQVTETLDELAQLADTAGAFVVDRIIQERSSPEAATYIGSGLVASLAERVAEEKIELVLFDDDLSPAQAKNLEEAWVGARVIDRTGLILDIFAKRARTREAITQVELAQLEYLLPRLTGRWAHLERQQGGIGLRGPGETQLETDRRLIREKISNLKRMLQLIEQQRSLRRQNRESSFRIALVGYTNAGKSTLLKALCGGEPFIEDRLFATLDPLVRPLRLPNSTEPALLTDTVGFIRKLPHSLVASFHSTLAEVSEANLLLHIADASHPACEKQMAEVQKVLVEIGADKVPTIEVFNKIDQLDESGRITELKMHYPNALFISALRGHRLWELKNTIAERRTADWGGFEVTLSAEGAGEGESAVYRLGEVIEKEVNEEGITKIRYRVPVRYQRELQEALVPHTHKPPVKKRALPVDLQEVDYQTETSPRPRHTREQSEYSPQMRREQFGNRDEGETPDRENRPPRREFDDRPPRRDYSDRPPRRDFGDRPPRREFGDRPPRREGDDRPPRRDFGDRPPRRDFGDRPPRREFGDRPPRREGDDRPPRRDFGDRPPRRDFGDRPPRREFGDRPPRREGDDRPPRRDFGDRPPRRDFSDRPPRREFGDRPPRREGDDRPPRRDFGDRPPRRDFGDRPPRREFGDRPPRREFGDRPPRREFGDRPPRREGGDRPPRREFGDRPPRREFGDRPPRREFGDRPPRREFGDRPPRREFGDRPPRREGGDRPPRREFGDRPPRREGGDRPPRREFGDRPPNREGGDRPPRREFGDRPPRREGGDRPARSYSGKPSSGKRYGSNDKPKKRY